MLTGLPVIHGLVIPFFSRIVIAFVYDNHFLETPMNLLTYTGSYHSFDTFTKVYDIYLAESVDTCLDLERIAQRRNILDKIRIQAYIKRDA
jgi:hypothetical protein